MHWAFSWFRFQIGNVYDFVSNYRIFLNILIDSWEKIFIKRKSAYQLKITWWSNNLRKRRNYIKTLYRNSKLATATQEQCLKYKTKRKIYKKAILKAKRSIWLLCVKKKQAFQDFHKQELYVLSNCTTLTHTRQTFYNELNESIFGLSEQFQLNTSIFTSLAPSFIQKELKAAIYPFNNNNNKKSTGDRQHTLCNYIKNNTYNIFEIICNCICNNIWKRIISKRIHHCFRSSSDI